MYSSGVMTPKLNELLIIAFDASYTHLYARRAETSPQFPIELTRIYEP